VNFQNTIRLSDVSLFALQAEGCVSLNMALGSMPKRPALLIRIVDSVGCYGLRIAC